MTPKKAYLDHKHHAQERGIVFDMTYAEWLEMWLVSGKWEQRGKTIGSYQMCRKGDTGGYTVRNCYIGSVTDNQYERHGVDDEETKKIKKLYSETRMSQREIAEVFNLTQSAISRIVNDKRREKRYA